LAGYLAFAIFTDLPLFAGIFASATVVAVGLDIYTAIIAQSRTAYAIWQTLTVFADLSDLTGIFAFAAVLRVCFDIDAGIVALRLSFFTAQYAFAAFALFTCFCATNCAAKTAIIVIALCINTHPIAKYLIGFTFDNTFAIDADQASFTFIAAFAAVIYRRVWIDAFVVAVYLTAFAIGYTFGICFTQHTLISGIAFFCIAGIGRYTGRTSKINR
jgi:hypothetical protein